MPNKEEEILNFLVSAYSEAKMNADTEMMIRLSRAIIAFSYNNLDEVPSWNKMVDEYMF